MSYIHKKKTNKTTKINQKLAKGLKVGAAHLLPGCKYVKAGEGGVASCNEAAAPLTDFLQREAKGQQVGTDCQGKFQQEAAKEVVLRLLRKHKGGGLSQLGSSGEESLLEK